LSKFDILNHQLITRSVSNSNYSATYVNISWALGMSGMPIGFNQLLESIRRYWNVFLMTDTQPSLAGGHVDKSYWNLFISIFWEHVICTSDNR